MSVRHVVLLVEDHAPTAEIMILRLVALGYEVRHAATAEQARAEIERGGFCVALLDLEIKLDSASVEALVDAGFAVLRELRARFPLTNDDGKHWVPIIIMSGHAGEPEARDLVYQAGADDVITKPLAPRDARLIEKLQKALERAGRRVHEDCAAAERAARPGGGQIASPATRRLTITARGIKRRFEVLIEKESVAISPTPFLALLTLAHAQLDARNGIVDLDPKTTSRLREELAPHLPGLRDPIPSSGGTRYSLDPSIHVEVVDWSRLGAHPDEEVRALVHRLLRPT